MVIKTIISKTTKVFKGLCTPARIEFILTIIGAIATIITCFASFSETKYQSVCNNILPSTIVSGIFIWILNALCKGGAGIISWILVVGPLFIMLFSIFFGKSKEKFGFLGKSSKIRQVAAAKAALAKAKLEDKKEEEEEEEEEEEDEDDSEEKKERKVGVNATKPIKKSKELIELEKKLAKLNSKIAKQTKKCVNKCTSKKFTKKLKKLEQQIKGELSDIKSENPDFS